MRRLAVLLLALALVSPTPALAADNPYATLFSPTAEASVPLNEPLLLIGGAFNGEAGGITEVDISTDDGATWTSGDAHTGKWTFLLTPTTPGPLTVQARAHTESTTGPVTVSRTVHVGGSTTPPVTNPALLLGDTPVPVQAGKEYVVSYYTPAGGYVSTENYFVGGVAHTPFYAPVNAGVYSYGGGFPTDTWHAGNYWVQPIFGTA